MIGRDIATYCAGRRDARRDMKRKRGPRESYTSRHLYLLGYYDELERMAKAGRLAQFELPLDGVGPTP